MLGVTVTPIAHAHRRCRRRSYEPVDARSRADVKIARTAHAQGGTARIAAAPACTMSPASINIDFLLSNTKISETSTHR